VFGIILVTIISALCDKNSLEQNCPIAFSLQPIAR